MGFKKLSSNTEQLLDEIVNADNPVQYLSDRFDAATPEQDMELRNLIKDLREGGYISVQWGDNKPYRVIINNAAKTYHEQLEYYEATLAARHQPAYIIHDNSVTIGNGNNISNTTIAGKIENESKQEKPIKSFAEKHPFLISVLAGLLTGFILLFSFWKEIIIWIEGLF